MKQRLNLIKKRQKSRLTQSATANMLNITEQHYQRLEAGTSDGSVKIWQQLSQRFNATINHLLEQETDKQQQDYTKPPKFNKGGIAAAKALSEAAKKFDVTDVALDVADNGRIDAPENWEAAQEYHDALGAVLA